MKLALTGGMGCGKSTVLRFFELQGWVVASADAICTQILANPPEALRSAIVHRWGTCFCDSHGAIDKKKVAHIIFSDASEKSAWEEQLHPLIKAQMNNILEKNTWVLIEVPLLYETEMQDLFDAVIAVWTPDVLVQKRIASRGWTPSEIESRMVAQISPEKKLERANYGLINRGDVAFLEAQCMQLSHALRA